MLKKRDTKSKINNLYHIMYIPPTEIKIPTNFYNWNFSKPIAKAINAVKTGLI